MDHAVKRYDSHEDDELPPSKRAKVSDCGDGNVAGSSGSTTDTQLRRSSRLRGKTKPGPSKVTLSQTEKGKLPRRRRATAGCLQKLMQMPVDIFIEIAAYLDPIDILNMARCTHSLRKLLMSKGSKQIWRMSRESLEIPECPEDLSEPQYADLLFGKGCYYCGRARAHALYFSLRIRSCASCAKENLVNEAAVFEKVDRLDELFGGDYSDTIWNSIPYFHKHYFQGKYLETKRGFVLLERAALDDMVSKYELYLDTRMNHRLGEFKQKQIEQATQIMQSSEKVEAWRAAQTAKRANERMQTSNERKALILSKLRDLGYVDQDFITYRDTVSGYRRWRKLLSEPKTLTDKGWAKMLPELKEIIAKRREARDNETNNSLCQCLICQGHGDNVLINGLTQVYGHPYTDDSDDDLDDEGFEDDDDDDDNDEGLGGVLAALMIYYGFQII